MRKAKDRKYGRDANSQNKYDAMPHGPDRSQVNRETVKRSDELHRYHAEAGEVTLPPAFLLLHDFARSFTFTNSSLDILVGVKVARL